MKKVMVVSGVTGGVGEELASKFIDIGWHIVGLGRNIEKLETLSDHHGKNFTPIRTDISDESSVKEAFNSIKLKFRSIDIMVNNAAIFKNEQFSRCNSSDIKDIIDTNLKGSMLCTLEAINIIKESKKAGRVINIASVAGTHGISGQAIYCASKYGLIGFSEALNQEIIKEGISITSINPGGIDTPLWNEQNPYPGGSKENLLQPNDIVEAIKYIANLDPRIILKNLTIFPSNEWH
ncbi:SDR family oxidoreductase [Gammaproteobacteria bacterium]|nr:SDR family oxidoreductase [Gammaproteobacteria bacterium]